MSTFRDPIVYPGTPVRRHIPLFRLCLFCKATYRRGDRTQRDHHTTGGCLS